MSKFFINTGDIVYANKRAPNNNFVTLKCKVQCAYYEYETHLLKVIGSSDPTQIKIGDLILVEDEFCLKSFEYRK